MLNFYRGRISYRDIKEMPIGDFTGLSYLIYKKSLKNANEKGQNNGTAEILQDAMEELIP